MEYSQKISERLWNLPDKGELESRREETYIDDIVQKSHIERTLLSSLGGVRTVFDGGAGCGRFSILLAKQGCEVTHFDISQPMLDKAQELAEKAGVLDRMTFVKGALEDLSAFQDRSFDLVISFDAPISYTYPKQEQVLRELVRICRKRLVLSVSSRLGYLPYLANPIQKNQFICSRFIINSRYRHGISGIPEIHKIYSLHNPSVFHIQTGYNSFCKHLRHHSFL